MVVFKSERERLDRVVATTMWCDGDDDSVVVEATIRGYGIDGGVFVAVMVA